jgi:tetratricopeptide (TPR) repeat protein
MKCPSCGGRDTVSHGRCSACGAALRVAASGDVWTSIVDAATGAGLPPATPRGSEPPGDAVTGPGLHADAPTGAGVDPDGLTGADLHTDPDATRPGGSTNGRARSDESGAGPFSPGQPFGSRYHIVRLLGIGGMGAVYQAWDAELGVVVALKVIRPEVAADPTAATLLERRFKQELLLARQVTHKNVVRIHELGEIDGIKFITMPFIEGEELTSIIRRGERIPIDRVMKIARGIATGLEAAHAAGVVHRDLKPANIMVDKNDEAMIMDFGVARSTGGTNPGANPVGAAFPATAFAGGQTMAGAVVGTVEYMAPEQARAQPVDQRADIYAFGLILYDMLLNRQRVHGADTALAELTNRMQAPPPALRSIEPGIPEPLERLVTQCIQPDAARRFQTTPELVAALNRLNDHGRLRPVVRRVTRRLVVAVASVFVALLGLTWWLARTPPPEAERPPLSVLVADFANNTGEAVFDGLLEQALTVGIEGARFISAYQRPAALRTARMLKAGDRLDEQAARLVALREGIKVVLLGSIEKRGTGYLLSVRGLDPTSSKEMVSSQASARDRDAVLSAGGTLAIRLRSALGDTRAADPRETFSSASLEAVAAYIRAQELSSAGRDLEALRYFKEATERDPGFGRAYGGAAMSATRLGRREEADQLWSKALAEKDRMTERERFRMEGIYFTLVTRSYDKAIDTYRTLVRNYPADGAAHNNLAVGYFRRLEFAQALEEGKRVLEIYPNSPLYRTNLALYAMYAGDFTTAAELAQKLVDQGQASYDTYLPLAVSSVANGRLDAARDAYGRMAEVDASGASLAPVGLADLALYEGRSTEATRILRLGIVEDQKQQNPAGVAVKQIALADALGFQGNAKAAVAAARAALAIDKTEAQIVPATRWLLAVGQLEEAAALGVELDNRLEPQTRAYGRLVAGQVALARGRRAEAVEALREALKLADLWLGRFNLGLAYLEAGYFAEALSEFELCTKRRGEGFAAFLDDMPTTRYVAALPYWVGRAHEGLGLRPQAEADYRTFLAARAADSPDTLDADARRRLSLK